MARFVLQCSCYFSAVGENLYWEVHKWCFITLVPVGVPCGALPCWDCRICGSLLWITFFLFFSLWMNSLSLNVACFFDLLPSQEGDQKFSDVFQCWKIKLSFLEAGCGILEMNSSLVGLGACCDLVWEPSLCFPACLDPQEDLHKIEIAQST